MRLNKIQSSCLFKATSPKVPRASNQHPTPNFGDSPCPFFLSLSLHLGVPHPLSLRMHVPRTPISKGCWVSLPYWFLASGSSTQQGEKLQRRGEEEDQGERSSIDRDLGFVQIQQAKFQRTKIQIKEGCSQLIPSGSRRSQMLVWLRENLFSSKSTFEKKDYKIGM